MALWALRRADKPVDLPLTRFSVDLGPDAVRGARITAVLSPDGTRLVFTGRAKGELLQLFTRRMDQAEAAPLEGTAALDTSYPFFSPDGKWIGFIAGGKIHKVAAQGGAAVIVGDAPQIHMGASWGEDGNIVAGSLAGLMRIPASGGVAQEVARGAAAQVFPQVLPGAAAVIFNKVERNNALDDVDIQALEFKTRRTKTLLHGRYFPRYIAPSGNNTGAASGETGYLVYVHDGTLFGVAFNPKDLEVRGTPTPLLTDIAASASLDREGCGQFAFSESGTFVYLGGRGNSDAYPILAMDASGKAAPLLAQTGAYGQPRFSPDGKRLAYTAPGSKRGGVVLRSGPRYIHAVHLLRSGRSRIGLVAGFQTSCIWRRSGSVVDSRRWIRAAAKAAFGIGPAFLVLAGWTPGIFRKRSRSHAGHPYASDGPQRSRTSPARKGRDISFRSARGKCGPGLFTRR